MKTVIEQRPRAMADNEPLRMVAAVTLRTILPQVRCEVELVIRDDFTLPGAPCRDFGSYVVRSSHGDGLLHELERSRVVEGERILDLRPEINICGDEGERLIQFIVEPPAPDEEG